MYVAIEFKEERFFIEAYDCNLHSIVPPQEGEPETTKTKMLRVHCINEEFINFALEPKDTVYIMNNSGKTVDAFFVE